MELENSFVVPAGIDEAWARLLDIEAVAPCMPGATLTGLDGESFSGNVKVKLGPVSMTYAGTGRFVETDETQRRVVIAATGDDGRGSSTATAEVVAQLVADELDRTRVDVVTQLAITGRPAQFGRGVIQDVAGRIIDQFATNLASLMSRDPVPGQACKTDPTPPEAGSAVADPPPGQRPRVELNPSAGDGQPLDLMGAGLAPILKRLLPVLAGLAVLALFVRAFRRAR